MAGSPQATEGCGEIWSPETGPTVGTLTRFGYRVREGTGVWETGEDKRALYPSMPWAQPQVLREGGQLFSGGINNAIYYFLLRTGSHTLYDTKSPFSPQETTTKK